MKEIVCILEVESSIITQYKPAIYGLGTTILWIGCFINQDEFKDKDDRNSKMLMKVVAFANLILSHLDSWWWD